MSQELYFTWRPCRNGHVAARIVANRTCIECARARDRLRNQKAERQALMYRIAYKTAYGRTRRIVTAAEHRAKHKGLDFDLQLVPLAMRVGGGVCEATGLPLNFDDADGTRLNPWAPSLDRKNPKKGYTMDNVQIVCNAYNLAKNEWPEEVLMTLVRALATRTDKA